MRQEQDLFNDILVSEKHLCTTYETAVTEAATPNIRKEFEQVLNDTLCIQDDVFKAMSERGWYKVEQAQQTKIDEAKNKYAKKPTLN